MPREHRVIRVSSPAGCCSSRWPSPVRRWCDVALTLSLDRSEATLADSMVLSVSVSGAHGDDARPSIQGLEDFLVRPAGTSTRVEIVNGRYSAGIDFSYLLQPKKAGSFRIGPAEVMVGGTTYRSNVAIVTVGQAVAAPAGERGPVFCRRPCAREGLRGAAGALHAQAVPLGDHRRRLARRPRVGRRHALSKFGETARVPGACTRGVPTRSSRCAISSRRTSRGSSRCRRRGWTLTVFTPQSRPRRGIFDDPFFGQGRTGRPLSLTSETRALQVLPLPREGRPADFGGLVGELHARGDGRAAGIKVGESATLTATVSGRGNAKRIPELKIPPLDGIKVYADQPVLKERNRRRRRLRFRRP